MALDCDSSRNAALFLELVGQSIIGFSKLMENPMYNLSRKIDYQYRYVCR